MSYTHIEPGKEIEVVGHGFLLYKNLDISPLVQLSMAELAEQEKASVEKENAIFEKMCGVLEEWQQQAKETIQLRKAQEYLRTLPVSHTSNQWREMEYGWHEKSNMVYKMTYRIYEQTRWNRALDRQDIVAWELSWSIVFNTTRNPDYSGDGWRIAGQSDKRFTDKAELKKYLQGRINAYAHLFTELSPPIPETDRQRFCVNGVLLPGYTVQAPLTPDAATVADLLACLNFQDGEHPSFPQQRPGSSRFDIPPRTPPAKQKKRNGLAR